MQTASSDQRPFPPTNGSAPTLHAYVICSGAGMPVEPAPSTREWMHQTSEHFAYRCLPMVIANQAGWVILNNQDFAATWSGDPEPESLVVEFPEPIAYPYYGNSLFGYGILTFNIPYLFRTPRGWNLLARGPANLPKDGVSPLEGMLETDWLSTSFTMNWKFTRPGTVLFRAGEPICMVVPQRRGDLETFETGVSALADDPQLHEDYHQWSRKRDRRNEAVQNAPDSEEARARWEKEYYRGQNVRGISFPEHQVRVKLKPFVFPGPDETKPE